MMTERLYYTDSYSTYFDATITQVTQVDGRSAVALDRTFFYPTSGGQPHDVGTLNAWRVTDVIAAADGEILHVLDQPVDSAAVGHLVQGEIDWDRRYDHMQQHAGQHLLSQSCFQLLGYDTLSVHFGATESTLDLDTDSLSAAEVAELERFANTMVFSNLPIRSYFATDDEVTRLPLRRAPKVTGTIRIVEIHQFDWSACGGTHVRTTGEIGAIKIVKQERRKNQTRLTFLCGWRSLRDYTNKHDLLMNAATLFSNEVSLVPELIARNQQLNKELQHRVDELNTQLLGYETQILAATAEPMGTGRVIVHLFQDKDAGAIRAMASQLQMQPGTIALLASTAGEKVAVVFARSDDQTIHAGNLLRSALQEFGGSGGGRAELAQGGGIKVGEVQAMLDFALAAIKEIHA